MNDLKVFKNDLFEIGVKLDNGEWVFDAEKVALSLGISQFAQSGNAVVRWERVNKYLSSSPQVGTIKKGDFIPEPAVYKLAFKASNEVAEEFQDWLAIDVLPKLRKTGYYEMPNMSKELQAIFTLDSKQQEIQKDVKTVKDDIKDIRENSPLYTIECKELQAIVKRVGTRELGGHGSLAYQDKSLRTKVYADIQCQLRREFGVKSYEAIKRCQFEKAKEIIAAYKVPTVLQDQVILLNNQISI